MFIGGASCGAMPKCENGASMTLAVMMGLMGCINVPDDIRDIESADRVSTKNLVPFRYLRTCFNFPQSSSSGCLTQVVENAIVVWMSHRTRERNRSCATV